MSNLDAALLDIDRACGGDAVIRDREQLEAYSGDESEAKPQIPGAVVRARSTDDVAAILKASYQHEIPVTPRAGGTGRVGGAVPSPGGIVLAVEKMSDLRGIEGRDMTTVVQPGLITSDLHQAVAEEGLFYPPDPNSLDSCAIGGNIGTNAAGPRAFKYGPTRDYVLGLTAVAADGTILQVGRQTKKGVAGYDLAALLTGSEGTLAVVTEATLRLIPLPQTVATLLVFLPGDDEVARAVTALLKHRIVPRCIELLDEIALDIVRPQAGLSIPDGARSMLLIELDGDGPAVERDLERCSEVLLDAGALDILLAQKAGERERLWGARRELSHAIRKRANHKLAEDIVVPRTKMAELLEHCRRLSAQHALTMPTYGHAGDGNLHVNFLWNHPDEEPQVNAAIEALFRRVIELGGTISGEHGIGLLKAPYLALEQSPQVLAIQHRIKEVFDPKGLLNPGKIFAADSLHGAC